MQATPHIMSRYDKDLGKLKRRILSMGTQVIDQMADATEALDQFDAKEVDRLVAFDRTINGMHQDIYTRSERLIALRQPMALDLRQVLLPINIAHELERIGDHAKSTAKRARILAEREPSQPACDKVREMSEKVQAMLAEALRAYDESNVELAATVRETDLTIDQINKDVFAMQVATLSDTPEDVEANVHLILLARGFERAGDHVVNIARHVHQIVTGIDLKASD
ncbi:MULTISPECIES: phosphate signaling complex protein PhoU [unclassified Roseovarius]|uniref:phosphate signaling complex protein PhoU n=1 Tax=unclassified Roseovarius TaxID=2614913 RepID=UPI00273E8B5A|nr:MULTISPECIES: phosphate signaling complex protein PhoU [unclassified Roseovarius]